MHRDPNRPVRGVSLRPHERHTDTAPSGNAGRDGYTRLARRPRVEFHDQMVGEEKADRIEGYAEGHDLYPYID